MALSTCDGSGAPLAHAEPADASTPSMSRAASRTSLRTPGNAKVANPGALGGAGRGDDGVGDQHLDGGDQPGTQLGLAHRLRNADPLGELGGGGEADDAGDVLSGASTVALLAATGALRGSARPVADPQRADPLRSVDLVRREREQVDAQRAQCRPAAGRAPAPHRCGPASADCAGAPPRRSQRRPGSRRSRC